MASFLFPRTFTCLSAPTPLSSLFGLRTSSSTTTISSSFRRLSCAAHPTTSSPKPRHSLLTLSATSTSLLFIHHAFSQRQPVLCDAPAAATRSPFSNYTSEAKTPVMKKDGKPNPSAFRQVSGGSIIGLIGGLAVASFSKTLVVLLGMGILLVQTAASRGINIIPTQRIQRYVKGIDVRSLLEDNVAFKVSFATTFIMAAFAEF